VWPFRRKRQPDLPATDEPPPSSPPDGGAATDGTGVAPFAPAAGGRGEWRSVAPIQRLTTDIEPVTDPPTFAASLSSWASPALIGPLGHYVSDAAPSGLIHDVPTRSVQRIPAAPMVFADHPARPTVQRLGTRVTPLPPRLPTPPNVPAVLTSLPVIDGGPATAVTAGLTSDQPSVQELPVQRRSADGPSPESEPAPAGGPDLGGSEPAGVGAEPVAPLVGDHGSVDTASAPPTVSTAPPVPRRGLGLPVSRLATSAPAPSPSAASFSPSPSPPATSSSLPAVPTVSRLGAPVSSPRVVSATPAPTSQPAAASDTGSAPSTESALESQIMASVESAVGRLVGDAGAPRVADIQGSEPPVEASASRSGGDATLQEPLELRPTIGGDAEPAPSAAEPSTPAPTAPLVVQRSPVDAPATTSVAVAPADTPGPATPDSPVGQPAAPAGTTEIGSAAAPAPQVATPAAATVQRSTDVVAPLLGTGTGAVGPAEASSSAPTPVASPTGPSGGPPVAVQRRAGDAPSPSEPATGAGPASGHGIAVAETAPVGPASPAQALAPIIGQTPPLGPVANVSRGIAASAATGGATVQRATSAAQGAELVRLQPLSHEHAAVQRAAFAPAGPSSSTSVSGASGSWIASQAPAASIGPPAFAPVQPSLLTMQRSADVGAGSRSAPPAARSLAATMDFPVARSSAGSGPPAPSSVSPINVTTFPPSAAPAPASIGPSFPLEFEPTVLRSADMTSAPGPATADGVGGADDGSVTFSFDVGAEDDDWFVQRAAGPSPAGGGSGGGGGGAGGAAPSGKELDELARRLYSRIRVHLRHELRVDRERSGSFVETGR
jgi:hypothetical protein